jgi:hypothetical protein
MASSLTENDSVPRWTKQRLNLESHERSKTSKLTSPEHWRQRLSHALQGFSTIENAPGDVVRSSSVICGAFVRSTILLSPLRH